MSPAGEALWNALDRPNEWLICEHYALHRPSNTRWWTSNGAFFFNGYEGVGPCLGLVERLFLSRKFHRMKSNVIASRIAGSNGEATK